jgi:hypothetical protein
LDAVVEVIFVGNTGYGFRLEEFWNTRLNISMKKNVTQIDYIYSFVRKFQFEKLVACFRRIIIYLRWFKELVVSNIHNHRIQLIFWCRKSKYGLALACSNMHYL